MVGQNETGIFRKHEIPKFAKRTFCSHHIWFYNIMGVIEFKNDTGEKQYFGWVNIAKYYPLSTVQWIFSGNGKSFKINFRLTTYKQRISTYFSKYRKKWLKENIYIFFFFDYHQLFA